MSVYQDMIILNAQCTWSLYVQIRGVTRGGAERITLSHQSTEAEEGTEGLNDRIDISVA